MNIAIIDADLLGRKRHRFPNLTCMKLSSYHKNHGSDVSLKLDYEGLEEFDHVYIAKVFTDTPIAADILKLPNVVFGGTGFAGVDGRIQELPFDIEHSQPDYHLYDRWAIHQKPSDIKFYVDFSIGYLTRGCFRHCPFCVNRSSDRVNLHSPLPEFFDCTRKKIALLDDNFFGCNQWQRLAHALQETNRRFSFRQGLDIRLLEDEHAEFLASSKYDGDPFFAFDNVEDAGIIKRKMLILHRHGLTRSRFYVLCAFDPRGKYDLQFWLDDLQGLVERISIIRQNRFYPYVMRYAAVAHSPFRIVYQAIAAWSNQPAFFRKCSFLDFVHLPSRENEARTVDDFQRLYPDILERLMSNVFIPYA